MPTFTSLYGHEDIVFLRLDREQKERVVVELKILPPSVFLYVLACGVEVSTHYEFEISAKKKLPDSKIGYSHDKQND